MSVIVAVLQLFLRVRHLVLRREFGEPVFDLVNRCREQTNQRFEGRLVGHTWVRSMQDHLSAWCKLRVKIR